MAPRKAKPAEPVKMVAPPPKPEKSSIDMQVKKLTADLKKHRAELSRMKAMEGQLIKKHENLKDIYAREAQKMERDRELRQKKHDNKMKKLRADTMKAKQELDKIKNQLIEDNVEQKLTEERRNLVKLKMRKLAAARRLVGQDVKRNGGEPLDWQCCEICMEPFNQERRPKVLKCGHTLCVICCQGMLKEQKIACPMDQAPTEVTEAVTTLPDNIVVLELCL
ncbi:hypothetical protein CAEBREN_11009 [Caenorhabditis brenneri]|uniref:RING-type domain-containing protein n=1 Tax=Caenorhabditis brenneri TaxID=135651 RepID=G0NCQ3_CAEBE|nr:hypothetical protein CAEBREN_11009 [Caenorhabditis brenneri]